jgi:hypothetical protein
MVYLSHNNQQPPHRGRREKIMRNTARAAAALTSAINDICDAYNTLDALKHLTSDPAAAARSAIVRAAQAVWSARGALDDA